MSQSPSSSLLRPLVVLVPGIGGSVLADACGRTVYDVNASKGVARVLDPAALAVDKELRATKPIRSYGIAFKQLVTGYENLWAALVQGLGLSQAESTVAGDRLVRPSASLLAFPYDFRQSVSHTAELLDRELRRRAQGRPVVLVAHSMGGLVAAWWWAFLSDGIEVKEIVTLGTPYRGAAKALDVLVNQLSFSGLRLSGITEVIRGWDSVFDLLPHCQVVEEGTGHCYPYELPPAVTSVVPDFAARARKAYAANEELHKRLEERASREGNPLTLYYSQGHATLSRTVLKSGVLTVSKASPSWLPREWDAGDGTVPMFSAIPHFLEDSARAWHRLPQKHLGLVEADTVANHLGGYGLRPLSAAARGGG
ncbi:lecithin--cholesterol acyltransferase, partial [Actinomyces oris]|uniref:lipase/acyltransferase domain-containing protein n=1 Tax=Actinomyces oris TaxID=544580 RepID=UPI00094DE84C